MVYLKQIFNRCGGYKLMNKGEIQAVHDDDLEVLLKSLGVYDEIKLGKHICSLCGTTIGLNNLLCVYPENGVVKFCCTEESCYRLLLERGEIDA